MMNYNIYTILNFDYFRFGKYLLLSIYDVCDLNKIDNIYIVDVGLSDEQRQEIDKFDKVILINDKNNYEYDGVAGEQWLDIIDLKTKNLIKLLKNKENYPICMIDSDMILIKDIYELFDAKYDIITNHRDIFENMYPNQASFVILNNDSFISSGFAERWRQNMQTEEHTWKETPAFSKTIQEYKNKLKINTIKFSELICENGNRLKTGFDDPYLLHFKGTSSITSISIDEIIDARIDKRQFRSYVEKYD